MTDEQFARQNEMAVRNAREADRVEPRADLVSYDPERGPGLEGASPEQLSAVRISPSADGLHWTELDVHLSLTSLMAEALNLREWAPRYMGQTRSEAKAKAARVNGAKGGRPRVSRSRSSAASGGSIR
ncbi:hypothetical protein BH23GEM5_BH23GEM5_15800 [soil metagenome]